MNTGAAATEPPRESLPLSGIKIVDLSQIGAGPAGASMGDLGADIIKVELLNGDSFRHVASAYAPGESACFFGANRSKRSAAPSAKDAGGV